MVNADRILAFRLARSGLAVRAAPGLAEAAACPASDFARDSALLALAARAVDVSREGYERAVDAGDLVEIPIGSTKGWLLREDAAALESPPAAKGIRLLRPGDPYLQKPNRPLLTPDDDLRKRLFRPVAGPGAVLKDGRLAGLWRAKAKGRKVEIAVEPLARLPRGQLEEEARRVAGLRGSAEIELVLA